MSGTVAGWPGLNITDRSGTIATGGVAQTLMAANSQRRKFKLQNISGGDLWWSATGTASAGAGSFRLSPGDYYETPPDFCPTTTVTIFGAVTGQAFTAREVTG